jgi:hypothetical protein
LVIKALDPDWNRIRTRIGTGSGSVFSLDPDPDEMNADPQPCRREEQNDLPDDLKAGDAVLVVLGVGFQVLNVDVRQACNTPLGFLTFNTFNSI